MQKKKIAVLVGSLRKASYNRMVAKALIALAPQNLDMEIVEIGQLQLYNQDLEENTPAEWVAFRERIRPVDGVLFVTPEYNRSFSAVIKNALDIGSRPYDRNVWNGKAGAVASVSISAMGAFGANHHLRQPMVSLNVLMMQQPEVYLGKVAESFNEEGELISERTKAYLQKFINAYADWVEQVARV